MNNILSKLPLFATDDSLDEDFVDYLSDANNSKLHNLIREKRYTVKDSDISYRVINHWDDKGLLPKGVQDEDEKWRKFSFVEVVWLEVLKELRSFGLSLESIAKIKEDTLNWNPKENTYPWFEYFVIKSMAGNLDGYLVVFSNNRSNLVFSRSIESNKEFFGSRSLLLISLKEMVSNLGHSVSKPESLQVLSEIERKVIESVRVGDVDSISLKMKKGKPSIIETEKNVFGSDIEKFRDEIKNGKEYADFLESFSQGEGRSAKITRKTKF